MAWYYNSTTGAVNNEPDWLVWPELHMGMGWHGPFATEQDLANFYNKNKPKNPGWKAPSGIVSNIINSSENWMSNGSFNKSPIGLSNPLTGVNAIGDFANRLTKASTWERVGEVLLGVILISIGVAHLTNAVPVATKIAGVVK